MSVTDLSARLRGSEGMSVLVGVILVYKSGLGFFVTANLPLINITQPLINGVQDKYTVLNLSKFTKSALTKCLTLK